MEFFLCMPKCAQSIRHVFSTNARTPVSSVLTGKLYNYNCTIHRYTIITIYYYIILYNSKLGEMNTITVATVTLSDERRK